MNEEEARREYAKWFVRDYYLRKQSVDYGARHDVKRCQERGYIRYCKETWAPSTVYPQGQVTVYDEYEYRPWRPLTIKPEVSWWRLSWDELDDPVNDDNPIAQRYRSLREYAKKGEVVEWLQAEAEFKKVTAEAWLRSYGVDIQSP